MTKSLKAISEKILAANNIAIFLHRKPDGDALGSATALKLSLPNKKVTIYSNGFDPIFSQIINVPKFSNKPESFDCAIVLDCNESHRTDFAEHITGKNYQKIIVIDHHHGNGDLIKKAGLCFVDDTYSATAEIVDELLKELRSPINPEIATALLLGIYTDTSAFRNSNTSNRTLERSSRLIRQGANLRKINQIFLTHTTSQKRRLWGCVLAKLEINRWGMATVRITRSEIKAAGAATEDVFGLANTLALITEAKAALVMVELEDGWRGILRTRHRDIDIGRLAKLLGGKGQKKAAGFTATKRIFSGKIDSSH